MEKEQDKQVPKQPIFSITKTQEENPLSADFNAHFLFPQEVKINPIDYTNAAMTYEAIEKDIIEKWYKNLKSVGFKPTLN